MVNMRYTFSLIKFKRHVYAIGGRQYGDDTTAILNKCERFDLDSKRWEQISDLGESRCTSNAFAFKDNLFVAGGYGKNSKRLDTIETFDTETKEWYVLGLQLYSPIEASFFVTKNEEVFYFGGRRETFGDCGLVYKFLMRGDDLEEAQIVLDQLG